MAPVLLVPALGVRVRQQKHVVDAQSQGQERHNLGGGSVENDADQGAKTQSGRHRDGYQQDAGDAQSRLRAHRIGPVDQRHSGVDQHQNVADGHADNAQLGELCHDAGQTGGRERMDLVILGLVGRGGMPEHLLQMKKKKEYDTDPQWCNEIKGHSR